MSKENFNRYDDFDVESYDSKGVSHYFLRGPGDRVLFPMIKSIENKQILEVGIGTGYYSKRFQHGGSTITGVDVNPHMGKHLNIDITEAKAQDFAEKFPTQKFDMVTSFWMTEYLSDEELDQYISGSKQVLNPDGHLFFTVIDTRIGWGWLYTTGASLKGIRKMGRSKAQIENLMSKHQLKATITPIPGVMGLPFAYIVKASK